MANILIVDDDRIQLRLLQVALEKAGHSVMAVEDGRQALDKLHEEMFDMLISDINMPGDISGFSLMLAVRKTDKLKDIPSIFMTGRRDKSDVMKAMEYGIDDYIVKPFDPDMLYAKIEGLLEKKAGPYSFKETAINTEAIWNTNFQITGISEQGMTVVTPVPFPTNYKLKINSSIFEEMDLKVPNLRVAQCLPHQNHPKMFSMRVSFIGLNEGDFQKLRRWIMAKNPRIQKNIA